MVTELTISSRFCNKNVSEHELPSLRLTSGKGSDMGTPAWSEQRLCFKHQADNGIWCHMMSTCSLRSHFLQSELGKGHVALQSLQALCTFKLLRRLLASLEGKFARPLSKKGLILHGLRGLSGSSSETPSPQLSPLRHCCLTSRMQYSLSSNFYFPMPNSLSLAMQNSAFNWI